MSPRARPALATALAVLICLGPARADWFIRGDPDASGAADITDAAAVLQHLFSGGPAPVCLAAADVDGDGKVTLNDAVALLSYLFLGGEPPALPFPGCGTDFSPTALECVSYPACESLCVVFSLDKSGSMNDGQGFTKLKQLTLLGIQDLPASAEFAVLFFDANLVKFPTDGAPVEASDDRKAAATAYVTSTETGLGTCPKPALLAALDTAAQSMAAIKVIVHISDGANTCPGLDVEQYSKATLAEVAARNAGAVRTDTVGVGSPGQLDEDFLRALASQNGGTFQSPSP